MKTALITGGSGDIGRAIAAVLIADGYRVGLLDLNEAAVLAAAKELGATGLVADVTDEVAVNRALEAFGAVPDVVVNNAGIGRFDSLLDMPIDVFRLQLDVNLTGAFIVARAAGKGMIARGSGVILNITSIGGITPGPGTGSYSAAKAGLAKLTEMMALEWGPSGVRANALMRAFPRPSTPTLKSERRARAPCLPGDLDWPRISPTPCPISPPTRHPTSTVIIW